MAGSKFRSYQIIKFMETRTTFLRVRLRERRDLISVQPISEVTLREIAEIDVRLKSPWLYWNASRNGVMATSSTEIGGLMASQLPHLKKRAIASLKLSQRCDDELIAAINRLRWSDMRDAFATHIYDKSGGNMFLVKQALSHVDVRTTRAYLRQRRQILKRFDAFRDVVETVLTEVDKGRAIDPTVLFLAANYLDYSQADRDKLAAYRTRMGMDCADPRDPDRHLAPNHPRHALCAVHVAFSVTCPPKLPSL